jgi:hypothetical protein
MRTAAGRQWRQRFPSQRRTDEHGYDGVGLPGQAPHITEEYPGNVRAPVLCGVAGDGGDGRPGVGGYAAAYEFNVNDYNNEEVGALSFGSGRELGDVEIWALFGMGGIKMKSDNH